MYFLLDAAPTPKIPPIIAEMRIIKRCKTEIAEKPFSLKIKDNRKTNAYRITPQTAPFKTPPDLIFLEARKPAEKAPTPTQSAEMGEDNDSGKSAAKQSKEAKNIEAITKIIPTSKDNP